MIGLILQKATLPVLDILVLWTAKCCHSHNVATATHSIGIMRCMNPQFNSHLALFCNARHNHTAEYYLKCIGIILSVRFMRRRIRITGHLIFENAALVALVQHWILVVIKLSFYSGIYYSRHQRFPASDAKNAVTPKQLQAR